MRVGILHYTAPPIVGGVEQLMGIHARLLREDGHDVTLLAGRGRAARGSPGLRLLPLLDSKHPRVLAVGEALARGVVPEELDRLAAELRASLREVVQERGLEALMVHNVLTLHFNLPLTVALHHLLLADEAPLLVGWCHDLAWTNPLYLPVMHPGHPWSLLRSAWPGVRYVVVSEDRRSELTGLTGAPGSRFAVIPAGVDPAAKLALRERSARLLDRFRLLDADPLLLLPVRITRRKNIEYAIRVAGHLRDDFHLTPRLVVTGPPGPHNPRSGDYVDELVRLRRALHLEGEVHFLFEERNARRQPLRVTDRLMDQLYRAADLLIFPSSQEGFGIPLLEAGIAGLPVFCADIPPFREIAGDRARFFALDDPPLETAHQIATFLRSDPVYRLRKHTLRHYTWQRIYAERIRPLLECSA